MEQGICEYIVRQISGRSRSRFKPEESATCARREGSVSSAVSKNQGIISLSRSPPYFHPKETI